MSGPSSRRLSKRPPSKRIEATFGFIDIAGFTALTEIHGDDDAADLATRLAQLTRAALGPDDRLIKTIGDAVLVTCPDPKLAIGFVDRLLSRAMREPSFPALRAGLHHGSAIERDGDVFGSSVNLAARVAAEAYAGEVLVTDAIAEAARVEGMAVIDIGPVVLKNVSGAVTLSSLGFMVGAIDSAMDPVCQAIVDRRAAVGQLRHQDVTYWFCSLTCAAAFASNPQFHVSAATAWRRE
ncbi:MAG: family 3 adenylate cyclase [Myxococcaceae bacterium]|nr:family 3 adenylate cyclase [Myxococcaceae bacterium]